MATAAVRDELTAPIERVWGCLADFGDVSAWAPGPVRVTVEGDGVGAVRTVDGNDAPAIRERLVAYDPVGHMFSYEMLDSPFPFTDYVATVRIASVGASRTAIEWSSSFEPRGVSAEEAAQTIESIYKVFIERLKDSLAAR